MLVACNRNLTPADASMSEYCTDDVASSFEFLSPFPTDRQPELGVSAHASNASPRQGGLSIPDLELRIRDPGQVRQVQTPHSRVVVQHRIVRFLCELDVPRAHVLALPGR